MFNFLGESAFGAGAEDVVDGGFDEVDAGFDNVEGDEDADVSFEVDVPDHVDDGGGEDGDREETVIKGVGATRDEGVGVDLLAGVFDKEAEDEFDDDAGDEDDDGDGAVFGSFGVDEFLDGFDKGGDASVENYGGDDERGDVFDTAVAEGVVAVGGLAGEFGADDRDDAR